MNQNLKMRRDKMNQEMRNKLINQIEKNIRQIEKDFNLYSNLESKRFEKIYTAFEENGIQVFKISIRRD